MSEFFDTYHQQYLAFEKSSPTLVSLIAVALLLIGLLLLRLLCRWFCRRLAESVSNRKFVKEGVRFRNWEILSAEVAAQKVKSFFNLLYVVVRVLLLLAFVIAVLALFPQTLGFAEMVAGYIGEKLLFVGMGILTYIPNLLFIALVIFLAVQVIRLLKVFMQQVETEKLQFRMFPPEYASPTRQILTFATILFTMVIIAPYLPGSGSHAFQAVTLFFGVLVSLGSSTAVANLIASFVLQYMRAFRVGDTVEIGGHTGKVLHIELFSTRIRTFTKEDVAIPNSVVLTSALKNYSQSDHVAVRASVSIGYDVPWPRVQEVLLTAARRLDGIMSDPEPFVLQKSLDDYYVSYELHAYTKEVGRLPIMRGNLNESVRNAFEEAEIEILSPAFTELRGRVATETAGLATGN